VKTEIAITSFIKNVQNLLYKTISPSSKNCNNNGETTTKPKRRRIRSFMKFTDKLTFELALDLCVGDFINFGNLKTKLSARKDDIQYIELIKLRDELYRRIER
jgi:hypothetical protein